jgi:hypothetical protein
MVRYDTERLHARFASGDVGDGFTRQIADFRKAAKAIMQTSAEVYLKCAGTTAEMHSDHVLPRRLLQQRVANMASFKNAREGAPRAFETIVRELTANGIIQALGRDDLLKYGKTTGNYFVVLDPKWLAE